MRSASTLSPICLKLRKYNFFYFIIIVRSVCLVKFLKIKTLIPCIQVHIWVFSSFFSFFFLPVSLVLILIAFMLTAQLTLTHQNIKSEKETHKKIGFMHVKEWIDLRVQLYSLYSGQCDQKTVYVKWPNFLCRIDNLM